jgi:hypothetical protein
MGLRSLAWGYSKLAAFLWAAAGQTLACRHEVFGITVEN